MKNDGGVSEPQMSAPEVVHECWVKLIQPAYQALIEGRNRFGLTDTDIMNQALQIWIALIQMADDSDILVRDRASRQVSELKMMTSGGRLIIPPAA